MTLESEDNLERIERSILVIRGHKIILDSDLAVLYEVSVGRLNEAVKRNRDRFPTDFMFQLTRAEFSSLRSQIATSNLKSQIAISSFDWGGRRHPPFAFTEQGVAMLSSVLRSKRAVQVNVEIMRAFVRLSGQARILLLPVASCLKPIRCTITAVFPITIRCD